MESVSEVLDRVVPAKEPFKHKENRGSIFVNDKKEKETHPDRRGDANIDGVEYWVAGWVKQTKSGDPFLSLDFTRKDQAQPASNPQPGSHVAEDDVPF
tara:strand:+ start:310 stop:603 length:294 start_codon:yes stop_codon:yes gene_type:complete